MARSPGELGCSRLSSFVQKAHGRDDPVLGATGRSAGFLCPSVAMKLYHLTAIPSTVVHHLILGSFTAPRQQELVTASSSTLQLYRLQPKQSQLEPLFRLDTFCQITQLSTFRLPGTRRDHIILLTDSGNLTVLKADISARSFTRLHCEPFGRTGIRRCVPSHHLAVEPQGRACMISALERQKFCYVFNRDAEDRVTVSSPLSHQKSNVVTYNTVAVDVGFENPLFAALERSYASDAKKMLVYYELDLGLNTLVRKHQSAVRDSSYVLLTVPGSDDGPGGVLVCSEGFVSYRNLLEEDEDGFLTNANVPYMMEARLPYRQYNPSGTMVVSGTMYHDRKSNDFFFLLCTEHGDLVKADLEWKAGEGVTALKLAYFDSLPTPAVGLCIFRSGFMFLALEGSDSLLLQFRTLDVPQENSGQASVRFSASSLMDIDVGTTKNDNVSISERSKLLYVPKPRLEFLQLVASMDSFAPLLSHSTISLQSGETALLCATGRGSAGSVRLVRRGIGILPMSDPLNMGGQITNIYAFKKSSEAFYDELIVVSFDKRTKVLAVGETKVEETAESGFELNGPTLCAAQMGVSSLVQVHKQGVRYVPGGRTSDTTEWKPPVPSRITAACCNRAQLIVSLSSGTLVYFEVDSANDLLLEVDKVPGALQPAGGNEFVTHGVAEDGKVPVLTIADASIGRAKASIFAVADGGSNRVRLYQVQSNGKLQSLGLHVAPAVVESLALIDFGYIESTKEGSIWKADTAKVTYEPMLSLVIGTRHGAMVRLHVDSLTGAMSGKRSKFLGPDPVYVRAARLAGVPTCLVVGSRPWLLFRQGSRLVASQMCSDTFEKAAAFSSEQSPDGLVAVNGSQVHLLCIDLQQPITSSGQLPAKTPLPCVPVSTVIGSSFQISRTRTLGTPRRLISIDNNGKGNTSPEQANGAYGKHAAPGLVGIIETDHCRKLSNKFIKSISNGVEAQVDSDMSREKDRINIIKPASPGVWFSRLRVLRLFADDENAVLNDEVEDQEDEFDATNLFQNEGQAACKEIDVIGVPDKNEGFLCSCASKTLGGGEKTEDTHCYLVASVAKNFAPSGTGPRQAKDSKLRSEQETKPHGALRVYRVDKKTRKPVFLHETMIEEPSYAVVAFRDMVLVGVGRAIRLYDLGKRKLLRKGECKQAVGNRVTAIAVCGGDRVFVGDVQESVTLFKYTAGTGLGRSVDYNSVNVERQGGRFVCIANDTLCRWFGNVFVLRIPPELASEAEELMGVVALEKGAGIGGSVRGTHQLSVEACIHVGGTVVGLSLGRLNGRTAIEMGPQGEDDESQNAIIYATMDGAVGVLVPLAAWNDAEFVRLVEHEMRRRYTTICGRDHLAYRSSFYAVKNVVDGDLCEMLGALPHEDILKCCNVIGQPVSEVMRRIEELRESWLG
ncbi:splicing factor 3B subunit 3 SF3B3 [Gracilaria domingensis]|nr:splicing factor 3B subunit 3 SF3B3 [Gracilaria domingensis]